MKAVNSAGQMAHKPFWHYTTGECFLRIESAGILRCQAKPIGEPPNPDYYGAPLAPGEPPTIWFSRNQWFANLPPAKPSLTSRRGSPASCP